MMMIKLGNMAGKQGEKQHCELEHVMEREREREREREKKLQKSSGRKQA